MKQDHFIPNLLGQKDDPSRARPGEIQVGFQEQFLDWKGGQALLKGVPIPGSAQKPVDGPWGNGSVVTMVGLG